MIRVSIYECYSGALRVNADNFGVSRAEVVFLVDNALSGLCQHGDLREGDFAVASVKMLHDAFVKLAVSSHNRHAGREVHAFESVGDGFLKRGDFLLHPASQIYKDGVDAMLAKNFD